jgi:ribosomal protein L35AE/L33A
MKARLVAFKGRRRDVSTNYGIIEILGENTASASLIGSKVAWESAGGKRISGVIVRTHGRDALLVRFRKGLPGEAVGDHLELKERPKKAKKTRAQKKRKTPKKKAKTRKKKARAGKAGGAKKK